MPPLSTEIEVSNIEQATPIIPTLYKNGLGYATEFKGKHFEIL